VSCPITLADHAGKAFFTQTIDISDGGTLVAFPFDNPPPVGEVLYLDLRIPSSSIRSHVPRGVNRQIRVVRHQVMDHTGKIGSALQFSQPLSLGLK
jgi:hypothetical protein